jgi:predicted nucleic acid-binding protein
VRLLLDTTVLIDVLRQRPVTSRLLSHRRAGDVVGTTAINIEEIVRGLRDEEIQGARLLFSGLVVVPLGNAEGWRAGAWRREYAVKGTTLSQPDCLIAAAALTSDARLVTGNPKDFPMPEIEVEHWPVGE